MTRLVFTAGLLVLGIAAFGAAQQRYEKDVIPTVKGPLEITFLGHASLVLAFDGLVIQVDPYGQVADYASLPKADLILVTHDHYDHLDLKSLKAITKSGTLVVASRSCAAKLPGAIIMANGESRTVCGLAIRAIPAYNILHKRPDGQPFHPKGDGNGYVVTFGDKQVYIRRHRGHARDESLEFDRRRLPAHERAVHDDARAGRGSRQGLPAEDPLSLPLWGHRYWKARTAPPWRPRHRGPGPEDELT
jgi:hypothetical protein